MVTLHGKAQVTLVGAVLLVVLALTVAAAFPSQNHPIHPGEGSIDPASGIHIGSSGDITIPIADSPVNNI
jgi:hypothetical protein